jgi:hypothetical protein
MRTGRIHSFFWVLVLMLLPAYAERHALLIGCNEGGPEVDPLRWAESDARRFSSLLSELGGFEQASVKTLLAPDSAAIELAIQTMRKKLQAAVSPEKDLFLLYYSGHADGRDLLLKNDRFPLRELQAVLDSLPSGIKIGVFDACHSGAITAYKGGLRAEPFFLSNPQKIRGQVIIASTTPNQRAQESESLKGSIFSYYWMNGLRGSADVSGDRRVTLDEAYRYAYRKTVEASLLSGGEAQQPMYRFNIQGQGDICLTDLTSKNGGIVFDHSCRGKFLILSDSYADIFADFFKPAANEWFVALDTGAYRIINADNGAVGMCAMTLDRPGHTVRFKQSMLVPHERFVARAKGPRTAVPEPLALPSTRPLSTWTWGVGCGVLRGIETSSMPVMIDFSNTFYINDRCDLFLDFIFLTHGLNGGGVAGFDAFSRHGINRLFAGAGAGLFHFEGNDDHPVSPALTLHAGFLTDIGRRLQFAVRIPYLVTYENSSAVHRIGGEVMLLIPGKYRGVTALEY